LKMKTKEKKLISKTHEQLSFTNLLNETQVVLKRITDTRTYLDAYGHMERYGEEVLIILNGKKRLVFPFRPT
jgi:hypothetical protein